VNEKVKIGDRVGANPVVAKCHRGGYYHAYKRGVVQHIAEPAGRMKVVWVTVRFDGIPEGKFNPQRLEIETITKV
jgi:hypothetical protein